MEATMHLVAWTIGFMKVEGNYLYQHYCMLVALVVTDH